MKFATKEYILTLLVAVLCVTLVATLSVTFSSSANVSGVSLAAASDTMCNHVWSHEQALSLAEEGGELTGSQEGTTYYLTDDVTLVNDIVINGRVELCLNGHALTGTGTGSVVTVNANANFVLYDCDENSNVGAITGGKAESGGGVQVKRNGIFTMNGGKISGNISTGDYHSGGGGVAVNGEFTMNGGVISGNESNEGGGVYVGIGTFVMNGGVICQNTSTDGGGVFNALYLYYGMYGPIDYDCGTFEMNDGSIENNIANDGAGVYNWGVFTVSGGSVIGNVATGKGGGVYNYEYLTYQGYVNVKGAPQIYSNTNGNVYLQSDTTITVVGNIEYGAKVGVTLADGSGIFTSGWSKYNEDIPSKYFFADDSAKSVIRSNDEASVIDAHVHEQEQGTKLFSELLEGTTTLSDGKYYLSGDFEGDLEITGDVELCLNGYKLIGSGNGSVITVSSSAMLTLHDCSADCAGIITGGKADRGGGVYVTGKFTMNGGKIAGNTATYGGGVYIHSNCFFEMNDGAIYGNTAMYGGGVCVPDNSSGGIASYGGCILRGGSIYANEATYGGGVYAAGIVYVQGAPIITDNSDNNVYIPKFNIYINTLEDDSSNKAQIGVTLEDGNSTFASGWEESYGNPSDYFTSDDDGKCIGVNGDKLTLVDHVLELVGNVNEHYNKCANCGEVTDFTVHNWNGINNYVVEGSTHQKQCPVCRQKQGVSQAHVVSKFTDSGNSHVGKCEYCSADVSESHVPTTTHSDPTCTQAGVTTTTCSVCKAVLNTETIPALGHTSDGGNVTQESTCAQMGVKTFTCITCNEVIKTESIAKIDHEWDEGVVTKQPTLEFDGVKTYTCVNCGKTTRENIPKLEEQPPVDDKPVEKPDEPDPKPEDNDASKGNKQGNYWFWAMMIIVIVIFVILIILLFIPRKKRK
ncbi:MAG: hypothetical protein J1G02_02585 [Clostridiales bacterium]|nr:hypothetical protein [Clostridiales bacterium]